MASRLTAFIKRKDRVAGKASLFAALAINIILLYVVNNLRYMGITQLTGDKLVSCMWSLNIIFGLAIMGNFILLLHRPAWLFYLVQILINAAGVNAFYFVYRLYPFNLQHSLQNQIVKIVILAAAVIFFLFFLYNLFQFGINFKLPKKKRRTEALPAEDSSAFSERQPDEADGSMNDNDVQAEDTSGQPAGPATEESIPEMPREPPANNPQD